MRHSDELSFKMKCVENRKDNTCIRRRVKAISIVLKNMYMILSIQPHMVIEGSTINQFNEIEVKGNIITAVDGIYIG